MKFARSGTYHEANIGFRIEFNRSREHESVDASVDVFPTQEKEPHSFEIETLPAVSVIDHDSTYQLSFDFNQLEEGWVEIKNTEGDRPESSTKLEVPEPKVFIVSRSILEGNSLYGHEKWLKENFSSEREGYHLLEFGAKAEKILEYTEYIKVLSFLADQHPRVAKVIADNSHGYFKNRVMNGIKPQSITSFSDLCSVGSLDGA